MKRFRESIVDVLNTPLSNSGATAETHARRLCSFRVQHIVFDGKTFVAASEDEKRHRLGNMIFSEEGKVELMVYRSDVWRHKLFDRMFK